MKKLLLAVFALLAGTATTFSLATPLMSNIIKELFHIESNKYPRWIQSPEWPIGENGVPMRFVSQKRKKGKEYETILYTEFLFEDVKTGEQRVVEQFT